MGRLGGILGRLEAVLERLEAILGRFGGILGHLGLVAILDHLGRPEGELCAICGSCMESCRGLLGLSWGPSGLFLAFFGNIGAIPSPRPPSFRPPLFLSFPPSPLRASVSPEIFAASLVQAAQHHAKLCCAPHASSHPRVHVDGALPAVHLHGGRGGGTAAAAPRRCACEPVTARA